VRSGEQVLVCPDCQRESAWADDLEKCPNCGSVSLARVLGDTVCRSCGRTFASDQTADVRSAAPPGLAEDVEAALNRLLRRSEN
jgi:hypothetical protein